MKRSEIVVYDAVISGDLQIDKQGRIWRVAARRGRRHGGYHMVPCKRRRAERQVPLGYLQVRLMVNGTRFHALAHRLVWMHFQGVIPNGLTINHKNGIKDDNRPNNLELATHSDQMRHAIDTLGTARVANQDGETNHNCKLSDAQVAVIRKRRSAGETLSSIAADFGVTFQTISKIANHQRR